MDLIFVTIFFTACFLPEKIVSCPYIEGEFPYSLSQLVQFQFHWSYLCATFPDHFGPLQKHKENVKKVAIYRKLFRKLLDMYL
jgi:hypothetical protein